MSSISVCRTQSKLGNRVTETQGRHDAQQVESFQCECVGKGRFHFFGFVPHVQKECIQLISIDDTIMVAV